MQASDGTRQKKAVLSSFFPRAEQYRNITGVPAKTVHETRDSSFFFTYSERHLQCIWFDKSLRPEKLIASSGEEVFVENPGRWNLEAGPDFLDAIIVIGPDRRKMRGDIEIHIHPSDWKTHQHYGNKAYSKIIAHISFFPGHIPEETLPAGTIQLSLGNALKANPGFSFENIDISAYPYSAPGGQTPPCAEILAGWNNDQITKLLESAGEERLRTKSFRMGTAIRERGEDQILYEEIMTALGYKHNSIAFRQLAQIIPLKVLRDESSGNILKGYCLLAGVSGLLPPKVSQKWDTETRSFIRQLWDNWWKNQANWETRRMPTDAWHLAGIRPQNSPLRRMAAAASLFTTDDSLSSKFARISTADFDCWHKNVQNLFKLPESISYWKQRLSFSGTVQKSNIALLGTERIIAIELNVLLPFLASREIPIKRLMNNLPPEQGNNLIRTAAHALLGRDHNPALYRSGLRQQGLIQIFHDFCLNNRSSCSDCLLVESIRSFSS
ncbi:MAG: hypothetical protein A2283_21735 [Lentisphaerae bacterium RIFOXYA12_FULL_48_11]|nr:MAG: hypothetical protein A2283_21735 [Lentisphaerae bacterium RIFOXYA12_FULL_48_11]